MGTTNVDTLAADAIVVGGNSLSAAELGYVDGVTPGTVAASKAVVVDANKDAASFRDVTVRTLTADAVAAGDSNLDVAGLPGAGGGAGGDISFTGGAGNDTGAGGATSLTGGASGAGATGNGGRSALVGGNALSAAGNGGEARIMGGTGGATGVGGAATVLAGTSGGAGGTAGSASVDAGSAAGGTAGNVNIGPTNALAVNLGRAAGKIGLFGATAVTKPTAYTQTYATADKTLGAYTADDESAAYTGIDNAQIGAVYATVADLNALRTAYETLRALVEDVAQLANAVVDDLQALGAVG